MTISLKRKPKLVADQKTKEKIEKLLNLSMSDNEHEAQLALQRALKLMNKYNVTEEEVYKQQIISKEFKLDYKRLPDWIVSLYDYMSRVSGCRFTWREKFTDGEWRQHGRITGRERDVENAEYLIAFLSLEIERKAKAYKQQITESYDTHKVKALMKSYRKGIVESVYWKLKEQHKEFFTEESKGTDLVCVDLETKLSEAWDFLQDLLDGKIKDFSTSTKYESQGIRAGRKDGEDIELNQAVNKQDEIKQIGA